MERSAGRVTTQDDDIGPYTASFALSLGLASLFNALLVIVKETNPDTVLLWMNAAGHHWVTQAALDLVVFIAIGLALVRVDKSWRLPPATVTAVAIGGVVLGASVIAAFFAL
jgi:hypothetical protein